MATRMARPAGGRRNRAYHDFVHTGPDTLAGRYMRTFWHPVYRSEDIAPGQATPIRIMGEDLTLYRGEGGKPYVVARHCPHRGAMLSVGWVEGEAIRCFYHGWKYDGGGACIEQPAEPKPFCQDIAITSYPAEDYLGLVFVYMGAGAAPPLPRYANMEGDDGLRVVEVNYRDFNFFQDYENGMDRVHGGFVHRSLRGSYDGAEDSPIVEAEEDGWGIRTLARHDSGRFGVQSFGMPNKQHLVITFDDCESLIWKVPVDDQHMVLLMTSIYRGDEAVARWHERQAARASKPQVDPMALAHEVVAGRLRHDDVDPMTTNMIWFQDNIVLLSQGAIADRDSETLGASDAPVVLLRKLWAREMEALDEGRPLKDWTYDPEIELRRQ